VDEMDMVNLRFAIYDRRLSFSNRLHNLLRRVAMESPVMSFSDSAKVFCRGSVVAFQPDDSVIKPVSFIAAMMRWR